MWYLQMKSDLFTLYISWKYMLEKLMQNNNLVKRVNKWLNWWGVSLYYSTKYILVLLGVGNSFHSGNSDVGVSFAGSILISAAYRLLFMAIENNELAIWKKNRFLEQKTCSISVILKVRVPVQVRDSSSAGMRRVSRKERSSKGDCRGV